ncbi:MAG: replication-relaxation family protein, partial [Planctomycetes bacterium]|nr:replication-relaxation family protein [Planctomycetota bacterium]
MASSAKSRQHVITQRDFEILTALDRTPLTVAQLLKLSQTFKGPFTNERYLRRRMQDLAASGFVRAFQYATTGNGAPNYYRLTLTGYRLLHGPKAYPPVKRAFSEVGLSHQHHTNALADFIVHTTISAHAQRIELASFYRENTLRIRVGEDVVLPDCAFELILPSGYQFNFLVELDNSTESIRSPRDKDSWERKIRMYHALQDRTFPKRFRVLVVTT